jgi:hypothetical protein
MTAAKKTVDTSDVKLSDVPGVPDTALSPLADLTPASDVAASGALIEPEIVSGIDTDHPAVDNTPRKGQTVLANQIDFNDPTLSPDAAVAANLQAPKAD